MFDFNTKQGFKERPRVIMVSFPKMVTPRRLSFGLLMVYLLYMLAMYMRDIKEEEKEQVAMEVEAVVRNIALNATSQYFFPKMLFKIWCFLGFNKNV